MGKFTMATSDCRSGWRRPFLATSDCRTGWRRPFMAKMILIFLLLLVGAQYLVNMVIYQHNKSTIFGLFDLHNKSIGFFYDQSTVAGNKPITSLEICPVIPPSLKGRITVNTQIPAWAFIEEQNAMLSPGGKYKPRDCVSRNRVAIIIPYRDREIHLKLFLQNLHPFLQRQQLDYGIYVVEMAAGIPFNRALLMNVGYKEALKQYDFQCFVFHDVDLLPEDDRNLYTCPHMPRHMSSAIDTLQYKLPYSQLFGGVSAINKEHFKLMNGFSNIYFGWGGEDDDLYRRILYSNLTVTRYALEVARYKMLVHKKDKGNPARFGILKSAKARRLTDGLTSLQYKVIKMDLKRLYTWIVVSVNMTEILENEPIHKISKRKRVIKKTVHKTVVTKKNETEAHKQVGIDNVNKTLMDGVEINKTANTEIKVTETESKPNINVKQTAQTNGKQNPAPVKKVVKKRIVDVAMLRRNNPVFVSWVPPEFKGVVPTNLTKFDIPKRRILKVVKKRPKKIIKKRVVKKVVAKRRVIKQNNDQVKR